MHWQVIWIGRIGLVRQTAHGIQSGSPTTRVHVRPLILLEATIDEVTSGVAVGSWLVLGSTTVIVLVFGLACAAAVRRLSDYVSSLRTTHCG